jgi:lysozyme family protein
MAGGFQAALNFVWQFDGLRHDAAPGEKFTTSYGVTEMTWAQARAQGIVNKPIEDATQDDCANILRVLFWNACHCSDLDQGVALMVFNDAMVCGVGHGVRLLQRIVGVPEDGVCGPTTLRATNSVRPRGLIQSLHDADETYFAALAKAPLFLKGWDRREDAAMTAALALEPKT